MMILCCAFTSFFSSAIGSPLRSIKHMRLRELVCHGNGRVFLPFFRRKYWFCRVKERKMRLKMHFSDFLSAKIKKTLEILTSLR
jgi:hypothetical protein